jgi:uncharacterized protein (DUF1778 family)
VGLFLTTISENNAENRYILCIFIAYNSSKIKKLEVFMSHNQTTTDAPTQAVNLRVRTDIRALIDRAAKAQSKTRSDFMIDAARRAAEESLLDQALVRVDLKTYQHFLDVLDQPPSGDGFERLMAAPKPWNV